MFIFSPIYKQFTAENTGTLIFVDFKKKKTKQQKKSSIKLCLHLN